MFKIGYIIVYGFYANVKIVDIDNEHYHLKDSKGNIKRVHKSLVNKHGKLKGKDI